MANTGSQAEAIRDLLVERLELFDPSLDTSEGSPLWTKVVAPIYTALGTDPFDTNIRSFLKDRLTQEYPSMAAEDGDSLVDLMITPLQFLLEPLKRETQIVRRGQSVRNADTMRLEDARDHAGNFFTDWHSGDRSSGVVRVYYANPTFVNVLPTMTFSTAGGLNYFPTSAQTIRPETMLLQRSGTEYYLDISLVAEDTGSEYDAAAGTVILVKGLSGYTRITNLEDFDGGDPAETGKELLDRTKTSLSERSLNVRRGIVSRINNDFPSIIDVEAVGMGDPEMERDIITGGGHGTVIATGTCFIVGQFCLMFSMFERRGELEDQQIAEGDEIELNYWKFLYDSDGSDANESFLVDTILFDSRTAIPEMPSILLFRIDGVPSHTTPIAGTLPGVLPSVFCVVRSTGKIEISDIPGGITEPNTARGVIEIEDGEVHIGGHYDVWARPSSTTSTTTDFGTIRSATAHMEDADLVLNGESTSPTHLVHRAYTLTLASPGDFQTGETITGGTSGAVAVIAKKTATTAVLWEMNGIEFEVGETVTGSASEATSTITEIDSFDWDSEGGVTNQMVLSVTSGSEAGVYSILKIEGPFLYIDVAPTSTQRDLFFRVLSEISVDLFNPRSTLIPFGDAAGNDLRTTIGSTTLRTAINLQDYGVEAGDTIEILDGDDKGTFVIKDFDSAIGGTAPIVVGSGLSATNSGLSYTVYRSTTPLNRPLVRISPGAVTLLDPSGQDSGYKVPYALPVDSRAQGAFSGSKAVAAGRNGFVLMDPGDTWAPTEDFKVDITTFDYEAATGVSGETFEDFYSEENFRRCYTDECLPCDGYIAVISVYNDGKMYLDANLPSAVTDFLQSMKDWFLSVIETFNFGGDEEELIEGFSPIKLEAPDEALSLLFQFEICIPFAVFDGCNNVFMAVPEFDWEAEFEDLGTFEEAISLYNAGLMTGPTPALLSAAAGDVLTVLSGPNAGSYLIDSVHTFYLATSGDIEGSDFDLNNAYKVGLVVIKGEFPVPALQGLPEYFEGTAPSWSVPTPPDLRDQFTVEDESGEIVGWAYVEKALAWFFQWMTSLGFDLPEGVTLDTPATLKAFWQLLFSDYIVAKPTCAQTARMQFISPTSCTVYSPQPCTRYQYALPVPTGVAVTGESITLPLPDLEGKTVSLTVKRLSGDTDLSATLEEAAGTASTISELAAELQSALDSNSEYVLFSGPETATGQLTITQATGGVDEWLYVGSTSSDHVFRWLGFFDEEEGKYAYTSAVGAVTPSAETIDTDAVTALGFLLNNLTTSLNRITFTQSGAVDMQIGEIVEGDTSGAQGVVYAILHDTSGGVSSYILVGNITGGAFQTGEALTGQTSSDEITVVNVSPDVILDVEHVVEEDLSAKQSSFVEAAEILSTALRREIIVEMHNDVASSNFDDQRIATTFVATVTWTENGDGTGYFGVTIEDSVDESIFTGFTVDDTGDVAVKDMAGDYFLSTTGVPHSIVGHVLTGDDYDYDSQSMTIDIDKDGGDVADIDFALDGESAVAFRDDIQSLLTAADYDGAAQALNATEAYYADTTSSERAVVWVGGGSLTLRSLSGGSATSMTLVGADIVGLSDVTATGSNVDGNSIVQGTTVPDETVTTYATPPEPTLFVAAAGAAELLFTVSPEEDAFQVFPGQTEDGNVPVTELPRDIRIGTPYDDQITTELAFDDAAYGAPVELGITDGLDVLHLHEHRTLLEHIIEEADAAISRDRVVAVATTFGSTTIELLDFDSPEYTFLAPNSGLDSDEIQVGDIVFIEEGEDKAGYTVTARTATSLTLDTSLSLSTAKIYKFGNDGVIEPDESDALFTSITGSFTSDDIGRYLTIFSSNREEYDGSYKITAVEADGSGCTLDTDVFLFTETDIHWAVVQAPTEDLADSSIGGRTALHGVRPIRIYAGTASEWRVARVTPDLDRALTRVFVAHGSSASPPEQGVKQPYRFVREGTHRISSTRMSEQRDKEYYYFDVLAQSLGGDALYNVEKYTKLEPVFGTFDSDGFRLETDDPRLTFSPREETSMVLSPSFLPVGFDDHPVNHVDLEGRALRVGYEHAPTLGQIQRLLSSETDRVLCANTLVRHFLPSFVSLDLTYDGGNTASKIAGELKAYIDSLSSTDEIDVSKLEKIFHANAVSRYDHPFVVRSVTHDLDRRLVGSRSENRLTDDDIEYNGTNRTTFFIAGSDHSSVEEADLPEGERIRLTRGVVPTTVR